MRIIILFLLITSCCNNLYSQDYFGEIKKQAVEIDSLKREIKSNNQNSEKRLQHVSEVINILQMEIQAFQKDSVEIHNYLNEKPKIEDQIKQKTDSLRLLKIEISDTKQKIYDKNREWENKAEERYKEGQQNVYAKFVSIYNGYKSFTDLITATTELSVERDLSLFANSEGPKQKLKDLHRYFASLKVLNEKYNEQRRTFAINQLDSISQKSELIDKLRTNLIDYKICSEGLKKSIESIIQIDNREKVNNPEIQKLKLEKILSILSTYIFNFNFNMNDYPYLSNILVEIIKRKQPNADADISDLVENLKE
jgi:carboxypeptidase C (cathepsin A)